jgi:plastocyanin
MTSDQPPSIPAEAVRRLQSEPLSRRSALRLLGATGLTATGISTVPGVAAQEASLEASAMATPALGEGPDGTRVWRVQVAGDNEAEFLEFMTFFPQELTINAGDTVFFDFQGHHAPHTVTFLSGEEVPKLIVPADESGTPAAGEPQIMFNPAAAFPAGRNTYDGTGILNSGLNVLFPPDQTFTVTFTAPGSFDYLCLVHPLMMKGMVTVQEQGTAVPFEQTDIDSMVAEHMAQLTEDGKALIAEYTNAATPAAGSTSGNVWDVRAGAEGDEVAVLRFMPDNLAIAAGDTVRWTVESELEPHTVTFLGGEEPPDLIEPQMQEGGPPKLVFNPDIVGRVGPEVYSGTGYANSGAMGADFEEYTGLSTYELTFDTRGEYPYYCALHGSPTMGMRAKVTVT